jgi:hypothetical protein
VQCCVLDLDTGLPVQVRDAALGVTSDPIPQSDVGKEYAVAQIAQQARRAFAFANTRASRARALLPCLSVATHAPPFTLTADATPPPCSPARARACSDG